MEPGTSRLHFFQDLQHMLSRPSLLLICAIAIIGCKPLFEPVVLPDGVVVFNYSVGQLGVDDSFVFCDSIGGPLNAPLLVEASGLAVSRSHPHHFWSHNDSGHPNRLFLIDLDGNQTAIVTLTGAGSRDYEDICIGPGPDETINYVYLGDTGDNQHQYDYVIVYRFPEPEVNLDSADSAYTLVEGTIDRFEYVYPDGRHDVETLMVDPLTRDLYFVTKRDFRSLLYRAPYPQVHGSRDTLELLAQFPFNWALGGDISPDGRRIAIKDFANIYCWDRFEGESVLEALQRQPLRLPYVLEPQGESFGWMLDGLGYITLSEQSGIYPPDVNVYLTKEQCP